MCNNKQQTPLSQRGFTLVELMVALLVFMVIMLGLVRGEIAAIFTNSDNLMRDEALRLAEEEMSRLKSLRFSVNVIDPELTPLGVWAAPANITVNMRSGSTIFARTTQITNIAAINATGLRRIDVAVGWNHGNSGALQAETNRNRQVTLSTVIVQND